MRIIQSPRRKPLLDRVKINLFRDEISVLVADRTLLMTPQEAEAIIQKISAAIQALATAAPPHSTGLDDPQDSQVFVIEPPHWPRT